MHGKIFFLRTLLLKKNIYFCARKLKAKPLFIIN